MAGDNDAGAFSTYAQAGQNYGTTSLWTLLLLIPVLYVNQEMVLRLGAVSGVGHARLILERFGKFWGAFSVIDLLVLNALTIVTEFIGISLALSYLGPPEGPAVSRRRGRDRRREHRKLPAFRASLPVAGRWLAPGGPAVPAGPPARGDVASSFVVPEPAARAAADVMLLIIAIVGTTVAPWQLFFQQSYVIDKRITPRWINYERVDLVIGIMIVIVGGVALMACRRRQPLGVPRVRELHRRRGRRQRGSLTTCRHGRRPVRHRPDRRRIIGAAAIGLSTAYATSDVLGVQALPAPAHHARPRAFTSVRGPDGVAAALVLTPHAPLGLLTKGVQVLAGVLLPSASVFLLLLCNDKAVLGPWANGRKLNVLTADDRLGARAPLGHSHGQRLVPRHHGHPDHRRAREWHGTRDVRR